MTLHGPTYIYSGEGAWPISVQQTADLLGMVLDSRGIKPVDSLSSVNKETRLVVVPGGSSHWMELGISEEKITAYVKEGGRFLGICAGGILASKAMIIKPNLIDIPENSSITALQRSGTIYKKETGKKIPGFLSLYPGKCMAPHIVKEIDPRHPGNLCAVDVVFEETRFKACHYSGPVFLETPSDAHVLLRYQAPMMVQEVEGQYLQSIRAVKYSLTGRSISDERPVAALSYSLGTGKLVLSGVHPEINPDTFPKGEFKLPEELAASQPARQAFVTRIFKELNLLD